MSWTYFPAVVTVNQASDSSAGTCPPLCTFRKALNYATGLALVNPATLVQFALAPGVMSQTADLQVGSSATSPITIDGTGALGEPSIVGDPLAAAQGNQGKFPRIADMANKTRIVVSGNDVTIKGMAIVNTVPTGNNPSKTLIASAMTNTRVEAVRLDGGAVGTCGTCYEQNVDLIELSGGSGEVVNVEGRSAFSNGVMVDPGTATKEIRDSWLHHNYGAGVLGDRAQLTRNTVELSGRQYATGTVRYTGAVGVKGDTGNEIDTSSNIIQNNTAYGIQVEATTFSPAFVNDYVCGNGDTGVYVLDSGGVTPAVSGTGFTTAYNRYLGLNVYGVVSSTAINFNGNSAFTANGDCGLANASSATVNAINNQWRDAVTSCTESPDLCSPSGVVCDPIQNYQDVAVTLDSNAATPSNALLKGQTVRVQGAGFNAIDGNPLAEDASCDLGDSSASSNCCRKAAKANVCVDTTPGSPPLPPDDHSNCVALKNALGQWVKLPVTGVTPTMIVGQVPSDVFECVGGSDEKVRAGKKKGSGVETFDLQSYCLNN